MINLLKGFIIGIGKVIPGVSGAVIAILMGVYDKSIYYINNFKKEKRKSIKYLLPLGIGIILSIIIFSKIINYFLEKYYLYTMLFFIGLIIGTSSSIIKGINKKYSYLTIISLLLFLIIPIISLKSEYVLKGSIIDIFIFFLSGIIEAIGTVVPGISSTALLMTMGTYKTIISSIGSITMISNIIFNLKILVPFCVGLSSGIIFIIKIIDYLLNKHKQKMYSIILGLLLSNIITLTIHAFKDNPTIIQLLISIIIMFVGILLSNIFNK